MTVVVPFFSAWRKRTFGGRHRFRSGGVILPFSGAAKLK